MASNQRNNAVMSREQRFRAKKWNRMFVSRTLITSPAFLDLRTATACQVFLIFLAKCQWEKVQNRPGRRDKEYVLVNNGEIQFTYLEAKKKWGISDKRFVKALDDLIRVGLIDIAKTGLGLKKDVTLYAMSDRWEKFGTDEFVVRQRPKRTQQIGFTNKNKQGRNCKSQNRVNVPQGLLTNVPQGLL